jgi:hypothetical protein
MYYDHSGPTPRRNPGEPPRTVVVVPQEELLVPDMSAAPAASYEYDADGVRIRTARGPDGNPYVPIIPPGYGSAAWSEDTSEWYAPRLSKPSKRPRNTARLYSPNKHFITVPKQALETCLKEQDSKCAVTGRKFRKGQSAGLIRKDVSGPLTQSNLVAVEKWMLEGEEPVNFQLLIEQWEARVDRRKYGNETNVTRNLMF